MKKVYAAVLTLAVVFLAGCFKQDYSLCDAEDNLVLQFSLDERVRSLTFTDRIESVDAMVFDDSYRYVTGKRLTKEDLEQFRGAKFTVPSGTYHVVCWGNVTGAMSMTTPDSSTLFEEYLISATSDRSASRLYYAPSKEPQAPAAPADYTIYRAEVRPNSVTTKHMSFTRAYRRVNVYVADYNHSGDPVVEMTNMPLEYDFFLRTPDTRKDYTGQSEPVDTPSGTMALAGFDSPISDFSDNMIVNLKKQSDLLTTHSLNLREYVEQNIDKIEDLNEIDILFEIGLGGEVTISLPDWNTNPVEPEM